MVSLAGKHGAVVEEVEAHVYSADHAADSGPGERQKNFWEMFSLFDSEYIVSPSC